MIPAICVHETRATPYAWAICRGYKTIETRTRDVLGQFVGEKVLVICTQNNKPAAVIGSAVIAGKFFCKASAFPDLFTETLIPPGSKYDCHGKGKWCYTMTDAVLFSSPIPLSAYTIERKTRSWAMLSA